MDHNLDPPAQCYLILCHYQSVLTLSCFLAVVPLRQQGDGSDQGIWNAGQEQEAMNLSHRRSTVVSLPLGVSAAPGVPAI